jgi:hypothetical protein
MTELSIRRIALACDPAADIPAAVEEAAALAERSNAALHGIFLDDENLYRLAGLPFVRQVTMSPSISESLALGDLERWSSALGGAMRRALARAAAERGLDWSFEVVRDLPGLAALAQAEADIIVVEGAARPFSGSWRPRSPWENLPAAYARTTLLRRATRADAGTLVILSRERASDEKLLAAAFALAGSEDDFVILVPRGSPLDLESVHAIAGALAGGEGRKLRVEAAAPEMPALLREIQRLDPVMLVLDSEADKSFLRELLAATRCNFLLVR